MKLFIGLGNPGQKYENNRHNIGFMVIDQLKNTRTPELQNFRFLKSDEFMNDSGAFVAKQLKALNTQPEALYIIHDDLDIKLGEYKIQLAKGPKDHNGIISIEESLGTNEFWRVRVGVENRTPGIQGPRTPGEKYVLENFTAEEMSVLDGVIKEICEKLKKI